ncbi:MAG: hypothetical protein JNN15_14565 [Blastocatellia bacterium]|nr:hypothetical protein [Blastocatellia bacterium]
MGSLRKFKRGSKREMVARLEDAKKESKQAANYYLGLILSGDMEKVKEMIELVKTKADVIGTMGILTANHFLADAVGVDFSKLSEEEKIMYAINNPDLVKAALDKMEAKEGEEADIDRKGVAEVEEINEGVSQEQEVG